MVKSKETVYIESSVISYLTGKRSHNLIVAANQEITRRWWAEKRTHLRLYISELVAQEIGKGNVAAAAKRRAVADGMEMLALRDEVAELAGAYLAGAALPGNAKEDALHIALATAYGMDYLLTWNCGHIANAHIQKKLAQISAKMGYDLPTICTPLELMGE